MWSEVPQPGPGTVSSAQELDRRTHVRLASFCEELRERVDSWAWEGTHVKIMEFERSAFLCGPALATMAFSGCSSSSGVEGRERDIVGLTELCQALQDATIYAAPRDAIPALMDPPLVAANDDEADYLLPHRPGDRPQPAQRVPGRSAQHSLVA